MATGSRSEQPGAAAARVLAVVEARTPRLAGGHLVCVDGPSGSGKTTLAAELVARVPGAAVVHTDELLDGWDGLPGLPAQLAALVVPLAAGRASAYRRYDWRAGRYAARVPVRPAPVLVLEGVGAGTALLDAYRSVLVWLDAPVPVRRARGLAREGADFAPYWEAWQRAELAHFAAERTRDRADLRVETAAAPGERSIGPHGPPGT